MKRLITALILFILIILLCFAENIYVNRFFTSTKNTVQALEKEYLNGIDIKQFENLTTRWEQNHLALSLFINRGLLDEVSDKISLLKTTYIHNRDEFPILAEQIILILENIEKTEKINLFGIL